jgi:hypothetical protein
LWGVPQARARDVRQTMNRKRITAAGQDGAACVLAEAGGSKSVIVQCSSSIGLNDLCVTSAPEMGTNRYQQDVA